MPIEIEQNPIQVTMIEDSVSIHDIRLSTMHLRYPRFIHAELMTHRVFSRNARSSRAVPVEKLLQEPIYMPKFLRNQKGMQAFEDMDPDDYAEACQEWMTLAEMTRRSAEHLMERGVHKQWTNRPLEWFGFIDVLVSSTDWANWTALRDHPDAMPEIQELARKITEVRATSQPKYISGYEGVPDGWHLPYVTLEERDDFPVDMLMRISAARCARISYKPFDGEEPHPEKDLELAHKLLGSSPLHASPAEHQATPDMRFMVALQKSVSTQLWVHPEEHGNFYGWRQFRKMLDNENHFDPHYRKWND